MAELNISVETIIHDALAEVAVKIHDRFGVKVEAVTFEWLQHWDTLGVVRVTTVKPVLTRDDQAFEKSEG